MNLPRRWPAPWVFSVLVLPLGISVGFKFTPLPFLLSQSGLPVDQIALIASIVHLPAFLVIFWAPVVDVKLRRRTWLVLGGAVTGAGLCAAFPLVGAGHVRLMTALILAAGVGDSVVMASCGGLAVKLLSHDAQAKAAAWSEAGQLGGGAFGGAVVLWLATREPGLIVGVVLGAMAALPALVALTIAEDAPEPSPWFRGRLRMMASELWAVASSPSRRWGTLLLVSPAGTGAALGLLPAIASHYGVGESGVMWINGAAGGAVLALGSLSGALIPGDWDRRLTYAGAFFANGLSAAVLLLTNRPAVYMTGTVLYLLTNGLVWSRFVALLMEIVGAETRDASTFFGALNAAGALPLLFMIWLDGVGYREFGVRGLLWTDAAPSLILAAIVIAVFIARGMTLRSAPQARVTNSGTHAE